MDVFDDALAPPAYQAVKPIANLLFTLTGVCWVSHYIIMIHKSFQDQSYAMGIMPLCCDFGWELVYVLVYPPPNTVELGVNITSLAVDFAVIYAAVRFSANEWTHTPLVRDNLHWVFFVGIAGFATGHLALAAQIGQHLAYIWGAVFCQVLISLGAICQLLCRGSTRGASYFLWLSRYFGSSCAGIFAFLRWHYWPEAFRWLNSPLMLWSLAAFILLDAFYGICYWRVKRYEQHLRPENTGKERRMH